MPSRVEPKSVWAEHALLDLAIRGSDAAAIVARPSSSMGTVGRHLRYDLVSWRAGNALVDMVSVAEVFTTSLLLSLNEAIGADELSTWPKRKSGWVKHAGVKLEELDGWARLQGFIQARNAIQHGLGRLTDQQLKDGRRPDTLAQLEAASIPLMGDRVLIDEDVVSHCHRIAERFIMSLDEAAELAFRP